MPLSLFSSWEAVRCEAGYESLECSTAPYSSLIPCTLQRPTPYLFYTSTTPHWLISQHPTRTPRLMVVCWGLYF